MSGNHKHFILPVKTAVMIGCALLVLTVVTVLAAKLDLGWLNFPVAMLIATVKASLVFLFFMGLYYDNNENRIIFGASTLFLTIFMVLVSTDIFFRGDVYVKADEPLIRPTQGGGISHDYFWKASPEMLAHGKKLFEANCVSCHGDQGKGNGPAAAALNPKPRNFTSGDDWKNGRKPTAVFKTVTEGLGSMPSFVSLPVDDRWGLVNYVLSLGPEHPEATVADLKSVGIDPSKADGGMGGAGPTEIPVELAIELMAEDGNPSK